MKIKILAQAFPICQITDFSQVNASEEFLFIGKTDEEISLVCCTEAVPKYTLARQDGWRAFRIQGILDFSLIGILSKISTLLAENQIGIFALSTYNTDYILTKEEDFTKAVQVLKLNGYTIE